MPHTFEVRAFSDALEEYDRAVEGMFTVTNTTTAAATGAPTLTSAVTGLAASCDFGDAFATPYGPGEQRTVRARIALGPTVPVGVHTFHLSVDNPADGAPPDNSDPVNIYVRTAPPPPPPAPETPAPNPADAPTEAPAPAAEPPPPESGGGMPVWGWVLIVVGIVLVVGGIITAVVLL